MKVSAKLALGYGFLLLLVAGLLFYHVSTVEANAAAGRKLYALTSRLLLTATDQRYWLDQMEESARKFRISGDSGYARQFETFAGRFDRALRDLEELSLTSREQSELAQLESTWLAFQVADGELLSLPVPGIGGEGSALPRVGGGAGSDAVGSDSPGAGAAPGDSARSGDAVAQAAVPDSPGTAGIPASDSAARARPALPVLSLDRWFAALRNRTERLVGATRAAMAARVTAADRRARRAELVAWAGAGAALLLSIVVWFFVVRTISRGLRGLTRATRTVAEGRFDHRLEVEGSDEFAELARDFNSMTERLAELDELKRHFVSRVSHDLKSPLASIQEANNLLLDGLPGELSEDQERLLELSRENGERLGEMISKLLETSRLEAGAETPDLARHDLSEVVREAAERLDPSFRKRGVELELRIPGDDQPAMCDAERVEQLVENLLENARRFAPDRSVVRVVLEGVDEGDPDVPAERWRQVQANGTGDGHGGAVLLSVEDAGPGVPEEEKERVFDRFFQSDGRGRPGGGVGLGLALCREVVAVHGGTIWVEDAPGGGARFRVLLPREPGGAAEREEATT